MHALAIQQIFSQAVQHHTAARLAEAQQLYRQVLSCEPAHVDAIHYMGVIAHQLGNYAAALDLIRKAIALRPSHADAYSNLGTVLRESGHVDQAIIAYHQAIALKPDFAEAYTNLGLALKEKGQLDNAIAAHFRAIVLKPKYPEAHNNLGNALSERGQIEEAIAEYRKAIALRPQYAEAFNNLGAVLKDRGQVEEAIAEYRRAIALNPRLAAAYYNLGIALTETSQLDDAVAACRMALSLNPHLAEASSTLGNALNGQGRLDQAMAAWRAAIALKPGLVEAHSNILYAMHFHPDCNVMTIAQEHRQWNRRHAEPLQKLIQPHRNDTCPERRLRIGYVSPHFRAQATSFFTYPLLAAHDHERFEIFCYCDVKRPDEITAKLQPLADVWRAVSGKTDEQIARLIREDQIDILVDLTMHMAEGRPLLFARKPAPVQVAWLAYPGTTGLATMDYRLTDPYLDPPGLNDGYYSETCCRLPDTSLCYDPLTTMPTVNALPALANGYVTFGSLNHFSKANDQVLEMWAAALAAVPDSKLLVLAPPGEHRRRMDQFAAAAGVDWRRIAYLDRQSRQQYLEYFHRIDIVLDTWPYNGETTSLDGLWMGVPMVTLCGRTAPSRAGLCYHSLLGTSDLVAHTKGEYAQIAGRLAGNLPRLAELRATLRGRLQRSPLMDGPKFAVEVEAAYRRMWRRWVSRQELTNLAAAPALAMR